MKTGVRKGRVEGTSIVIRITERYIPEVCGMKIWHLMNRAAPADDGPGCLQVRDCRKVVVVIASVRREYLRVRVHIDDRGQVSCRIAESTEGRKEQKDEYTHE